jgi:hypothetical protein
MHKLQVGGRQRDKIQAVAHRDARWFTVNRKGEIARSVLKQRRVPAPVSRNGTAAGRRDFRFSRYIGSRREPLGRPMTTRSAAPGLKPRHKRTHGHGQVIAGHSVGDGVTGVGTPTTMTAACVGPEAAVDVLKDALSY